MDLRWLYGYLGAFRRLLYGQLPSIFCALFVYAGLTGPVRADSPCGFPLEGAAARLPQTQALAQALFKKYPMNEYEFVFVGRSLTILQAYVQALAPMYPKLKAWNLPLSLKDQRSISDQEYLKRFEDVFFRFRGGRDLGTRKLVFIDFIETGRTMAALDWLLRRSGIPGELAGVTDNPLLVRENMRLGASVTMRPVELFPIDLKTAMDIGTDRWYAPYPQGRIQDEDFDTSTLQPAHVEGRFTDAVNAFKLEMFGSI